ncbi:helix-turn-helix domain-containing protein [Selenomonas ruminantium]|uniref:helix-turn-helix domain-containing protein n=1 Tax=Selenomonas ruminantium TaxID=971 RepID=UPI0012FF1EF8|nr:helix-turn-helix transcriptional regulator [Selenomonas ruminantium]
MYIGLLSFSTRPNYERESREPNIAMLIKLADLYEVSVDYLLGHTPDKDMPEDIKELVDKYNRLSDEGRLRINNQIDCELRVDALIAKKRLEKQRQGIEASRQAGKQYGRPKATITADWDVTYSQWKSGDITADDAALKLGISKATLYRRARQ